MFPTFELFGKTIGLYPLLSLTGGLLAGMYACSALKKRGRGDNEMIVMLLIAALGALAGGAALFALTNLHIVLENPAILHAVTDFPSLLAFLKALFGGSVFYGGLLGGIGAGLLYLRIKRLPVALFADCAAPAIPLLHAFGRIGCFLGGCCYGIECRLGFTYQRALVESANGVSRFPVQLLESALNLLLFALLARLSARRKLTGLLLPLYLLCYSASRFWLEFLRGDEYRGFVAGLSTSQVVSVLLFALAAGLFAYSRRRLS